MMHFFAKRYLSAYLDDALNDKNRNAVRQHLERCSSCRQLYAAIKQSTELIQSVRKQSIPSSIVYADVRSPSFSRYGWVAAAAAFLFAVGTLLFSYSKTRSTIDPQGAIYLDLLLQEAANSGSGPQLIKSPYHALAQSPVELSRITGRQYAEPVLPSDFRFQRGFIYEEQYGGGVGRVYVSNEGKILCLFEQPVETKMAYGAGNQEVQEFLGRDCIEVLWPSLRLVSCESGDKRILMLSNISTEQLESAFRSYPDLGSQQ
ncbi:zf-HC2 domain-containing protein [bacterium]|nr:zf-HC2 domain-containing protein [bacterium]MCI0602122.1 zf-HC2 domain-containing protein [bacterium]